MKVSKIDGSEKLTKELLRIRSIMELCTEMNIMAFEGDNLSFTFAPPKIDMSQIPDAMYEGDEADPESEPPEPKMDKDYILNNPEL